MDFWQILGGTGIFLFGIRLFENALKQLMSRRFKLFLKKHTSNPLKAILGGTFVTAILQSSSAVNFMVLAFVSTGVMELANAFAVIMGANLGTTVTSWMVATVGFSVNIEQCAYPLAGLAGLAIFIFEGRAKLTAALHFVMGFSLLFIGLQLMQSATEGEAIKGWMDHFSGSPAILFLLLGLVATTVTQSSAATVAITLSLLNQQLLGFESAMAAVIGSEVGTAMKLILGSLDGVAIKKRVSAGNLIYNIVTTVGAFVFLHPFAILIMQVMDIKNPLFGLVTFQSLMNLFSLLLFLPFLRPFSKMLEKMFTDSHRHASLYLQKADVTVPETAIEMLRKESDYFIRSCMEFGFIALHVEEHFGFSEKEGEEKTIKRNKRSFADAYNMLKELFGEINAYYVALSSQQLDKEEVYEKDQLIDAVRSAMYAAKCMKDVRQDVLDLENSSRDIKFTFMEMVRTQLRALYGALSEICISEDQQLIYKILSERLNNIQENYSNNIAQVYKNKDTSILSDLEFATLMNFNRAVYTSNKSMVMSWKNFLLDKTAAEKFSEIPTYQS